MLPQGQRLKLGRDIVAVTRWGRTVAGRGLLLHVLSTPKRPTRFAIVVSRQTEKRAVRRNRVKRKLRSLLADFRPRLQPSIAVIIRVRPPAIPQPSSKLRTELEQLFTRARLLT